MKSHLYIRPANDADVPVLRRLVNSAYKELLDMGMNYTGATQDEAVTRERMQDALVLLAFWDDNPVATVTLSTHDAPPALYVNQLAVSPQHRGQGLARLMFAWAESEAKLRNLPCLMLDTATRAHHLVNLYRKYGFEVVEEVQWSGKSYTSFIMRKDVPGHPSQESER